MGEMLLAMPPKGISLLPLSNFPPLQDLQPHASISGFSTPSPPSFGNCEFAIKTVLCRIALWDCFRRRILARLGVLCNLITANKTSEFPRHSHNAIRQTVPSLTCNPQRVVSSTEQIYSCWTVNLKRFNKYNKKFTQNFKVRRETWVKSWTYTRWLCGRLGSLT